MKELRQAGLHIQFLAEKVFVAAGRGRSEAARQHRPPIGQ